MEGAQAAEIEAHFSSCCHLSSCDLAIGFFCEGERGAETHCCKGQKSTRLGEVEEEFNVRVGSSSRNPRKG